MVNVNIRTITPGQRQREKVQRMQKLHQRPGIRVTPKNDDMRRLLKHPRAGAFRSEGSMEWPDDSFTHRRLRDGDIKREEKKTEEKSDQAHHRSPASHQTKE